MSDTSHNVVAASSTWKSSLVEKPRIKKSDMCLIVSLWMEKSPLAKGQNKCGVVLLDTRQIIAAVECTRSPELHPAVLCVALHGDRLIDANVYMSRPPCSICVKALVQAKVKRIFYLPRTPENESALDRQFTDTHVRARSIGMSDVLPDIPDVMQCRECPLADDRMRELLDPTEYEYKDFRYPSGNVNMNLPSARDESLTKGCSKKMKKAFEWMMNVAYGEVPSDSCRNEPGLADTEIGLHNFRLAHLLSYRADDANHGDGAVLLKGVKHSGNRDFIRYLGIGWSGYPRDARPTDYQRVTDRPDKEPFVVSAAYNTLMFRNEQSAENSEMYLSSKPSEPDIQLLRLAGVSRICYLGDDRKVVVVQLNIPDVCHAGTQTSIHLDK